MLLPIKLSFFHSSGSSLSDKVRQHPAELFKSSTDTKAEISCSHSIDNYNVILWYKQTDRDLQLLGWMVVGGETLEKGVKAKITGNANKDSVCTLTITELNRNSSAVYFCAASLHSAG